MTILQFPGGPVAVDPEAVWSKLKDWTRASPVNRCTILFANGSWFCTLSWASKRDPWDSVTCSSELSMADAVANALQAVDVWS